MYFCTFRCSCCFLSPFVSISIHSLPHSPSQPSISPSFQLSTFLLQAMMMMMPGMPVPVMPPSVMPPSVPPGGFIVQGPPMLQDMFQPMQNSGMKPVRKLCLNEIIRKFLRHDKTIGFTFFTDPCFHSNFNRVISRSRNCPQRMRSNVLR